MMGGKPLDIDGILRNAGKGEQPLEVVMTGQDGKGVKMDWRQAVVLQLSVIDANTKAIQVAVEKIAEGNNDVGSGDTGHTGDTGRTRLAEYHGPGSHRGWGSDRGGN